MSFVYYNEWDGNAAEWLRELIRRGELPAGEVDTRSITEVDATDLKGFTSWHFFAGIGGWPLALRMAGVPDDFSVLTGSPPCQPFSVAGLQKGKEDERHLAPVWLNIIKEYRPERIIGEQVADAIGKGWLDDLFDALEREGYACGAAVLPACSVGAPHIRKRLFFGAVRLANFQGGRWEQIGAHLGRGDERSCQNRRTAGSTVRRSDIGLDNTASARCFRPLAGPESQASNESRSVERPDGLRNASGMADAHSSRRQHEPYARSADVQSKAVAAPECRDGLSGNSASVLRLADANDTRPQGWTGMSERADKQPSGSRGMEGGSAYPDHSFWSGADWIGCRDGKFRPVEPGTQPLAHGLPARVGRLRGYGNAIVPQVAAAFVTEFFESVETLQLLGDL